MAVSEAEHYFTLFYYFTLFTLLVRFDLDSFLGQAERWRRMLLAHERMMILAQMAIND